MLLKFLKERHSGVGYNFNAFYIPVVLGLLKEKGNLYYKMIREFIRIKLAIFPGNCFFYKTKIFS